MAARKHAIDAHTAPDSVEIARQRFDWSAVGPTTAIAETLAAVEGTEPGEIGPLYESVDSDALDALVRNQDPNADCAVVFPYEEYSVTVTASGTVAVYVNEERLSR